MRSKIFHLAIILLMLVTALTVTSSHRADAGAMTAPGGWVVNVVYCTNGFTATAVVPASITANRNHRVYMIAANPAAWMLGGEIANFFSVDGVGGFSISKNFYWRQEQAVGTPVTGNIARFENTTLFNSNNSDADFVQNCTLPPIPIEILQSIEVDGRINKDFGQTGAVYCLRNGIEVLYAIDGDPREGKRALYVSNTQYMGIGVPLFDTVLAQSADGYVLYRLANGHFLFTAPDLEPGKLYRFEWLGC